MECIIYRFCSERDARGGAGGSDAGQGGARGKRGAAITTARACITDPFNKPLLKASGALK